MAALFDGSTGYLANTSPPLVSTGYPITAAAWFKPLALPVAGNGIIWEYTDTGASPPVGRFDIRFTSTGKVNVFARDGSTAANATTTASATLGAWHFAVARWIGLTNRRMAVLFPDGSIEHVSNTTSVNPSSMDTLYAGALPNFGSSPSDFFNGAMAEWWYADADIQADGAQLSDRFVRQLAFGGPFSVAPLQKSIVEYHSALPGVVRSPFKHYVRGGFRSTGQWTTNGGITLAPDPSLTASYQLPSGLTGMVAV